jgi:HlyD family secretion protein
MASNGRSGWWKWIVIVAIVAAVGAGWWYHKRDHDGAPDYETAPVTRGDVIQAVTATGTLNPVTNVTVGSQISGIIQSLGADWNSRVKAGQIVAQLDPATYKANVAQSEGDLANAKATLELNQIEAKRSTELFNNKLISESDYDTAIANLHQAEAQVQIKEAALSNSMVNLSRCTIYSPVDGIVISRNVDIGQTVAASLQAPTLFVIANDLAQMQIDASVAEADVGGVQENQPVNFTVDAFPYRTFHGKVIQVRNSPSTVQNVVTYDTVIGVNNADLKLKPGMTANVSIITAEHTNVLKIPNAALRFRMPETESTNAPARAMSNSPRGNERNFSGGGPSSGAAKPHAERNLRTVYVLPSSADGKEGEIKPKPVQIKTGINDGIATEVLDGLNEGDRVITGVELPDADSTQPSNPFGGGFPRRR